MGRDKAILTRIFTEEPASKKVLTKEVPLEEKTDIKADLRNTSGI